MIGAPEAAASVTSDSVMPPTPECRMRARIRSVEILLIDATIASTVPCVSALTTSGYSIAWFAFKAENMLSRLAGALVVRFCWMTPAR